MIKELDSILASAKDESYYIKKLNIDTVCDLLRTDYSDALLNYNDNKILVRGEAHCDEKFFHSKPKIRIAQNTINIINRMVSDILPSWKEYPKRNHSFICSSSPLMVRTYGIVYYVFPKNGTKLGICPNMDFWYSFKNNNFISSVNEFNYELKVLFNMYANDNHKDVINEIFKYDNKDQILILLREINANIIKDTDLYKKLETRYVGDLLRSEIKLMIKNNSNIIKLIDKMLDPSIYNFNNVDLTNYNLKNIQGNLSGNEIWFNNNAIFIKEDNIEEVLLLIDKVQNNDY